MLARASREQTIDEVQDVHLSERWKSGSTPSGCSSARNQSAWTVVIPSSAGAEDVRVEPVADENRLVRRSTPSLVERPLEDRRVRLALADLRREHHGVEPLGEALPLEVGLQEPVRASTAFDTSPSLKTAGSQRVEQRVGGRPSANAGGPGGRARPPGSASGPRPRPRSPKCPSRLADEPGILDLLDRPGAQEERLVVVANVRGDRVRVGRPSRPSAPRPGR